MSLISNGVQFWFIFVLLKFTVIVQKIMERKSNLKDCLKELLSTFTKKQSSWSPARTESWDFARSVIFHFK